MASQRWHHLSSDSIQQLEMEKGPVDGVGGVGGGEIN